MLAEMLAWRPPNGGSRPLPVGSRSIGVSLQPAIPRRVAPQQSPLPLHRSPTMVARSRSSEAIKCDAQPRRMGCVVASAANGVSFLLCTPGVISILRRHNREARADRQRSKLNRWPCARRAQSASSSWWSITIGAVARTRAE
jgi:hypothetical protein